MFFLPTLDDAYRLAFSLAEIGATQGPKIKRTAASFHDHIVVKETGNSVLTLWHHDPFYYLMGGPKTISF